MGQIKIKVSENAKDGLFSNLENSLCEMNVEAFSKVFLSPIFFSAEISNNSDQGYDPEQVDLMIIYLDTLFNEFKSKDKNSLKMMNANCSKDWCNNDSLYNFRCFYNEISAKYFVIKYWYDDQIGFRLQTCKSLMTPEQFEDYDRLFLDENWKDASYSLTWEGGSIHDMFG